MAKTAVPQQQDRNLGSRRARFFCGCANGLVTSQSVRPRPVGSHGETEQVPAGALPKTQKSMYNKCRESRTQETPFREIKVLCSGWKVHAFTLTGALQAWSQQCNQWGIVILAPRFNGVTRDHGTLETVR